MPLERAALVSLITGSSQRVDPELLLEELSGLASAAGAAVVLRAVQERQTPDPATLIGSGKAEQLAKACGEADADVVIVDNDLSPAQGRNLEKILGRRVIDRTQLILDIFARRARTREGKLQVELAQLQYLMPRLVGSSEALSRLGGGIGTRGPGETKLETDRRGIRHRISKLKGEIAEVQKRRGHLRARRSRREVPTVALVGYTNAGKTTLFNALTGGDAVASDALFVTLDPLVRKVKLPDKRQILLSDTVGFIDRLPHQLVAAFQATLEEVAGASLLLHIADASATDRERRDAAVRSVLEEVGAGEVPTLVVFNKCDLLSLEELLRLKSMYPAAVFVSALHGMGRTDLLDILASRLEMDTATVRLTFDPDSPEHRKAIADLYRQARVLSHVVVENKVMIDADVPRRLLDRLARVVRVQEPS
ncbi:MAG: GTPase HflX [Acidobacteria bacterium]|nr:GTPase HflX [Acidobacteriota bacterium]